MDISLEILYVDIETGFNIFNVACVQTHPPLSKKKNVICTEASLNVLQLKVSSWLWTSWSWAVGWASHVCYLPVTVDTFSVPDPNLDVKGPKNIFPAFWASVWCRNKGVGGGGGAVCASDFMLFWVTLTQPRLNAFIFVYTSFVHFKTM